MSLSVGVYDAKTQFTKLLQAVEAGETVTITRHGKPVAELKAARPHGLGTAADAVDGIRILRQKVGRLEGTTIPEMLAEDHR